MVNTFRATGAAWVPPAAVAADGEAEIAGSDPMPTRLEDCATYREGYKLGGTMVSKKLATARQAAEILEEHAPKGVNMPGRATLGTAAKNPGVSPVKRGRKDDLPQWFGDHVSQWVEWRRTVRKFEVQKDEVLAHANAILVKIGVRVGDNW